MSEVVVLLGAVSVLTVAVMDPIRLTLGQIFSLMDGFYSEVEYGRLNHS